MVIRLVFLSIILLTASGVFAVCNGMESCVSCHAGCITSQNYSTDHGCVWCHRGNGATTRKTLAHNFLIGKHYAFYRLSHAPVAQEGKRLIKLMACRRCHVQAGQGNKLATNLDQLLAATDVGEIDDALHQPAFYMPDFVLAPHQMISLITQILSGGVGYSYDAQIAPRVVHFEDGEKLGNLFEKYCGSCHRVLTDKYGGLGSGVQAPNLSGLLSEFYPANYKNNQRWNADGVRIWVNNPRKIRPLTMMPPQIVNEQELVKLVDDTWGHD